MFKYFYFNNFIDFVTLAYIRKKFHEDNVNTFKHVGVL